MSRKLSNEKDPENNTLNNEAFNKADSVKIPKAKE